MTPQAKDRLIVALDLETVADAERLVERLGDAVTFYKVGLVMQLAEGTDEFIRRLIAQGKRVFLDYKYYDVPETLRKAISRAAGIGVSFLTIHGSGNLIRAAVAAKGSSDLKLFTVTVLTAMDQGDIREMGYSEHEVGELVAFRARKALEAGCDGVIASGQEAETIKELSGGKLLVITPGIRPDGYPEDPTVILAALVVNRWTGNRLDFNQGFLYRFSYLAGGATKPPRKGIIAKHDEPSA